MTPALQVQGLVKRYGGVLATDHVDLSVDPHEIHALIGPNGAGKTTLVHQLSGSLRPDRGSIRFFGTDVTRMPMHRRVLVGLSRSHQITNVFGQYTVLHNLLLAAMARSGSCFRFVGSPFDEAELVEEADRLIGTVALAGRRDVVASTLSHGEQRKLEIALALGCRPKVLLLDEPLAGMGPSEADEMVALIQRLKTEAAIVLVEHDMGAVFRLADRVTVLVYGKVIASDAPQAIRSSAAVRKAYLGEAAAA